MGAFLPLPIAETGALLPLSQAWSFPSNWGKDQHPGLRTEGHNENVQQLE